MEYVESHKDSKHGSGAQEEGRRSTQAQAQAHEQAHDDASQHPIGIYLKVWLLLFVLSALSYLVDYLDFQGMLRWSLIIIFMLLKAGFIVAIFMHVMWERMTLITAILGPPAVLLFLVGFMASEGEYTFGTRVQYMGQPEAAERIHVSDVLGEDH